MKAARLDPITGLIAFPDFHAAFPRHLADAISAGCAVGVAIGDVDHLKEYVENSNTSDPEAFGHLAGNAFMARLGVISTAWFREQRFPAGCVSTFGGDELIVAAVTAGLGEFTEAITELRDQCRRRLPRTVSFALTVMTPHTTGATALADDPRSVANQVLARVDRALFAGKAARRPSDKAFVLSVRLDMGADDHVLA